MCSCCWNRNADCTDTGDVKVMAIKVGMLLAGSLAGLSAVTHYSLGNLHKSNALSRARGIAEMFVKSRQVHAEHRTLGADLPVEFAKTLAGNVSAANVRTYSLYPFPRSRLGGLHGNHEKRAWKEIAEKKTSEVVVWEGRKLKYCVPAYMTLNRVAYHNSANGSPKKDWKVGDVRGVIEVTVYY